jgi:hypothetical protein
MKRTRAICLTALMFAFSLPIQSLADERDERNRSGHRGELDATTIAARQHFFGFENVSQNGKIDEDKVIITWFSVQSYAVAVRGRVFLLDSYIYRVADAPPPGSYAYVPTTVPELVALKPEAIFIGHGHGDHADNAAYIAVLTGAAIFGAAEHCESMRADAIRIFGPGTEVKCTSLTTPSSDPGAEVREIDVLRPDVCVTSFKHVHSGAQGGVNPAFPGVLVNPIRDPRVDTLFPALPPPALDTRTVALSGGGPISMFYQFTVADSDFSFVWHDTNGPVVQVAPQVLGMLERLPKVDVEIGSLVSSGEAVTGVRDIGMYIQAIKPKIFYGGHSDNFNIGATVFYHRALQSQLDVFNVPANERPDIRGFHDPYDYLRPGLATFDLKNKVWRETPAGKSSATCRF